MENSNIKVRKCTMCGITKSADKFAIDKSKKDNLSSGCLECRNKRQKELYILHDHKTKYSETRKRNKVLYSLKLKGLRMEQKLERQKLKDQQKKEKELMLEEKRIKKQSLLDEKLKRKEYRNSEEYKLEMLNREKERRKRKYVRRWDNDPLHRFKKKLRNNLRNSIVKRGFTKKSRTYDIIGIEYADFKDYFEKLFVDGMSWDNHGDWHIDHIIPLSTASNEDELIKLCHYTNLQPLWAEDNLKKGTKII